jgi:hypothetical protein
VGLRNWIGGLWRREAAARDTQTDEQVARWRKALADFGYPHDLVSGAMADEALAAAKEAGRSDGFVPVILVPGHWNSHRSTPKHRAARARELLQITLDGKDYLAGQLLKMRDDLEFDPEAPNPDEFDELRPVEADSVPAGLSITKRYIAAENVLKAWDEVAVVRVPAASADELPAYFDWGGWNGAPNPEMMVVVARYWQRAYGAELVAIGSDLLEFSVERPPQDHASAVALLREHYVFAPDNLEFDRDVLERAAAQLQTGRSWVFWWD